MPNLGDPTHVQRLSAGQVEQGCVVGTGCRTRVVVAREHRLLLRFPERAFGDDGGIMVRSGRGKVLLRVEEAVRRSHGHLVFSVPLRKGEAYTVSVVRDGVEHDHLVHGEFSEAIDAARSTRAKHGPVGTRAVFARPPDKAAGKGTRAVLGTFLPCPACEVDVDEEPVSG